MTPDKFGNVYLVDRDTGLDHGPCTVLGAREILAQENNKAKDGGHRYADKDEDFVPAYKLTKEEKAEAQRVADEKEAAEKAAAEAKAAEEKEAADKAAAEQAAADAAAAEAEAEAAAQAEAKIVAEADKKAALDKAKGLG